MKYMFCKGVATREEEYDIVLVVIESEAWPTVVQLKRKPYL